MTPRQRRAREEPELDSYGELISRARAGVPTLPTASLYRIHALLERLLEDGPPDEDALAALAAAVESDNAG